MTEKILPSSLDTSSGLAAPPASQSDLAYAMIEELIVTLKIAPGELLTEQGLAARLGIGRTPVREALQRLERDGLVLIEPRRGAAVTELDVRRQLRMLEVRRYLERYLATAAARRASKTERQKFAALGAAMRSVAGSDDPEGFLKLDRAFNRLLVQAARNEFAETAMLPFQALSRRFWFAYYPAARNFRETCVLHADLAEAIAKGDTVAAETTTGLLLDNVEAFTRASLDSELAA